MPGHHFIVCIPADEYCSNNCTTDSATSSSSSSSSDLEESTSDELEEKSPLEKSSKATNDEEDVVSPSEVEPLISGSPDSTETGNEKSGTAPPLKKPASQNDLPGKEKDESVTPDEENNSDAEKRMSKLTPEEIEQLEDVPEETEIYSLSEVPYIIRR